MAIGVNKIAKASKRQQEDSNLGSLDCECDVLTTTLWHHTFIQALQRVGHKTTPKPDTVLVSIYNIVPVTSLPLHETSTQANIFSFLLITSNSPSFDLKKLGFLFVCSSIDVEFFPLSLTSSSESDSEDHDSSIFLSLSSLSSSSSFLSLQGHNDKLVDSLKEMTHTQGRKTCQRRSSYSYG